MQPAFNFCIHAGQRNTVLNSSPYSITNAHSFEVAQPKALGISLETVTNANKKVKTVKGKGQKTTKAVTFTRVVAISKTKNAQKPKASVSRSGLTGGRAKAAQTILTLTQGNNSYRPDLTAAALGRASVLIRASQRMGAPSKYEEPVTRNSKRKAAKGTA